MINMPCFVGFLWVVVKMTGRLEEKINVKTRIAKPKALD